MTILELMNLGLITDALVMRAESEDKANGTDDDDAGDLDYVFQDVDEWSIYENGSIKGLQHAKGNGQVDLWTIQKDGSLKDESSVSLTEDQFKNAMLGLGFRVDDNGELTIKDKTYKFSNNGEEFAPASWADFLDACAETLKQPEDENTEEPTSEEPTSDAENGKTVIEDIPGTTVEGSSNSDQNSQDKWWWDNTDNKGLLGFNTTALKDGAFEWPDSAKLAQLGGSWDTLTNIQLATSGHLDLTNGPQWTATSGTPKHLETITFSQNATSGAGNNNTVTSNENIRIDRIQSPQGTLTLNGVKNDNLKVDETFRGTLVLDNCNFKNLDVSAMAPDVIIQMDEATYGKLNDKNSLSELIQNGKIKVGGQRQQTFPTKRQTSATPVSAPDLNAQQALVPVPNPPDNSPIPSGNGSNNLGG